MEKKFIRTDKRFTRPNSDIAKSLEEYKPGGIFSEEQFKIQQKERLDNEVKLQRMTEDEAIKTFDSLKGNVLSENSYAIKKGYISIYTGPSLSLVKNQNASNEEDQVSLNRNDSVKKILSTLEEVHEEIANLEKVLVAQEATFNETNSQLQEKRMKASQLLAQVQTFFECRDNIAA